MERRRVQLEFHDPSLTEQEHKDSCDINKMMLNLHRGLDVRGGRATQYGYDDTTMDGLTFRIQKANLEKEMSEIAENVEFTQAEYDSIPDSVKERYKLRVKQEAPTLPKNDDSNDDKTASSAKSVTPPTPVATPPKNES